MIGQLLLAPAQDGGTSIRTEQLVERPVQTAGEIDLSSCGDPFILEESLAWDTAPRASSSTPIRMIACVTPAEENAKTEFNIQESKKTLRLY